MTTDRHAFDSRYELNADAADALRTLGRQISEASVVLAAGQLWRAAWAEISALVIVLSIEGAWAQVVPVTVDVDYADPFTAVLRDSSSPLPVPVAVFAGLGIPVPLFTLDTGIGSIDAEALTEVRALRSANLRGELPSVGVEAGTSDVDSVDVRREFRIELSNTLAQLALADLSVLADSADVDMDTELRAQNIGLADVKRMLSVDLSQARLIATGAQPLTAEQAELLAPALQRAPSELVNVGTALNSDLIAVLHDPYEFGVVRLLARRDNVPELVAARSLPTEIAARSNTQHSDEEGQRFWREALAVLRERLTDGN